MRFFPYENINLETAFTEEEIYKRLNDFIEFDKSHRIGLYGTKSNKKYSGQIIGNSFYIKRIINYRNSFLPRIEGTIISDNNGIRVNLKLRLYPVVLIFMIIWLSILTIMPFIALNTGEIENGNLLPILIPFFMMLFGFLIFTIPFKIESRIALNDLTNLLSKK